jgi:glutathione synthase/RimK-type ligase-like ATP-grasp enzyme
MAEATLLHVVGSDQAEHVDKSDGKLKLRGSTDIHKLVGKNVPYHRLHVTPNFFRQRRRPDLSNYLCLLNLITEPERNSRVLENMRKVLRDLPGKIVNRPEAVLRSTRDQVARRLAGIAGLWVPRTVRVRASKPAIATQTIARAGLQLPIIVREAGTHTGRIVGLFDNLEAIQAELDWSNDHIATEFVDFRSADGFYRKYRVFFIGRHIIFRHMLVSDEWNVHAKDRRRVMADRPELLEEEERMFAITGGAFPPGVGKVLETVRERMGLDFFGMDFGIANDGRVVLFEANATMNFFPFLAEPQFAYLQRCLAPAQEAFREMIGLAPPSAGAAQSETNLEPAS